MQVILLKDVARVGRQYDVVDVSNGYANNFLIPRKLAELATPARVQSLEKIKENARAQADAELASTKEKLTELAATSITLELRADDQGHLFKKVRPETIAETLTDDYDIELSKESILLDAPIGEVGDHEVPVEVGGEQYTLTVSIVAA